MYQLTKNLEDYSFKKLDLSSTRAVVRSCLNVAVDNEGKVTDSTRLYESLPLIRELGMKAENVVITGHLGRPEGREKKSSFWNVAEILQSELSKENINVVLVDDLNEVNVAKIQSNKNSDGNRTVFLLENVRFFKGEESKEGTERLDFAKELAALGNSFINDAFADYRESASTYDVATLLPSYLGPVFLREVESITKFNDPAKPFVAILGGAKLSEKLDALNALIQIADKVIIGGAMSYTLMKAQGINIGNSRFEADKLEVAKEIVAKYREKLVLPVDHMIAPEFNESAAFSNTENEIVPDGMIAIDIGLKSIELYKNEISKAKSILCNGPMGVFEWDHAGKGTQEIMEAVVANEGAYKFAGGGDSIAAINKYNIKGFDHVSTGGGAMLSFLAYDKFPVLDVVLK